MPPNIARCSLSSGDQTTLVGGLPSNSFTSLTLEFSLEWSTMIILIQLHFNGQLGFFALICYCKPRCWEHFVLLYTFIIASLFQRFIMSSVRCPKIKESYANLLSRTLLSGGQSCLKFPTRASPSVWFWFRYWCYFINRPLCIDLKILKKKGGGTINTISSSSLHYPSFFYFYFLLFF